MGGVSGASGLVCELVCRVIGTGQTLPCASRRLLSSPGVAAIVIKILADDEMETELALMVWRTGIVCGTNACMFVCVQGGLASSVEVLMVEFLLSTVAGKHPGRSRGEPRGSCATVSSRGGLSMTYLGQC